MHRYSPHQHESTRTTEMKDTPEMESFATPSPVSKHMMNRTVTMPAPCGKKRGSDEDITSEHPTKKPRLVLAFEGFHNHSLTDTVMDKIFTVECFESPMKGDTVMDPDQQFSDIADHQDSESVNLHDSAMQTKDGTVESTTPAAATFPAPVIQQDVPNFRRSGRLRKVVDYAEISGDDTELSPPLSEEWKRTARKTILKPRKVAHSNGEIAKKSTTKNTPLEISKLSSMAKNVTRGRAAKLRRILTKEKGSASDTSSNDAGPILQAIQNDSQQPNSTGSKENDQLKLNEAELEVAHALIQMSIPTRNNKALRTVAELDAAHALIQLSIPNEDAQIERGHSDVEAALTLIQMCHPLNAIEPPESALRESFALNLGSNNNPSEIKANQIMPQTSSKPRAVPAKYKVGNSRKPRIVDTNEFFMPSAENDFKFKYDSPSGRTVAQLNALFMPPARPAKFPWDVDGLKALSYLHMGARPKKGIADSLVTGMEIAHAKDVKKWEEEQDISYQRKDVLQEHSYGNYDDDKGEDAEDNGSGFQRLSSA